MSDSHYDVVVIGTGPGGEGAAMQAAKAGKKVLVVEKYQQVGGGCTHWGTIPSKALRFYVWEMMRYRSNKSFAVGGVNTPSYPELLKNASSVISSQVSMREGFYDRNQVPVEYGIGRIVSENRVSIERENGVIEEVGAEHIVVATGSRPWHPDNVDFDHPRIVDSDSILMMDYTPGSLAIYGAGVIGCEYASIFKNLGLRVNLINTRSSLLEFLDDEITDALSYHMRDQGIRIRHNEVYESIEGQDDCVIIKLKSGKQIKSDVLLWANGRSGNTLDLGLENVGIEANHRGQLDVNENYQTSVSNIYAVGDVAGPPALASAAYDQGRFAASHIVDSDTGRQLVEYIPTGIYTSPEISSIGKTEAQLTEEQIPYEVGHAMFKSLARAQILGNNVGMLKILFHPETLAILGIHCFGKRAAEIIHIGQAIMTQPEPNNTLNYFVNTTFNYPTMAEAYRVAALNGLNRLF